MKTESVKLPVIRSKKKLLQVKKIVALMHCCDWASTYATRLQKSHAVMNWCLRRLINQYGFPDVDNLFDLIYVSPKYGINCSGTGMAEYFINWQKYLERLEQRDN